MSSQLRPSNKISSTYIYLPFQHFVVILFSILVLFSITNTQTFLKQDTFASQVNSDKNTD